MALTAQVRTRDGWAVAHAAVTLTDTSGGQVLRAAADEDGVVTDDTVLTPGPYVAVITAVGWSPTAATAIVTGSGRADLGTITLNRQGDAALPPPGPWTIDPAHSTVGAVAQHLGISSVRGRFTEFTGAIEIAPDDPAKSSVEAVIDASSIDTGNRMRDDHLRSADFLDVAAHPRIAYRSTGLTAAGADRWTVHGELSMHGRTRDVDLEVAYLGTGPDAWGGTRAAFHATTQLRREDFAIDFNQAVATGIAAIGTTLKVELDIQAVQGDSLPEV